MSLPPMPPWSGFHVLLVHFPIALLLVAPLLMGVAIFFPRKFPGMAFLACLVLFLGVVSSWVAKESGEAAEEFNRSEMVKNAGEMPEDARNVLESHERMGGRIPWMFTGLFGAYLLVILLPVIFRRLKVGPVRVLGTCAILIPYAFAAIYLADTAHQGGLLVHFYGIQAPTAESVAANAAANAQSASPAPEAPSASAPVNVPASAPE